MTFLNLSECQKIFKGKGKLLPMCLGKLYQTIVKPSVRFFPVSYPCLLTFHICYRNSFSDSYMNRYPSCFQALRWRFAAHISSITCEMPEFTTYFLPCWSA